MSMSSEDLDRLYAQPARTPTHERPYDQHAETVEQAVAFWRGLTVGLACSVMLWFALYALIRGWSLLLDTWWSVTA
jgi:hypothetical protein